MRAFIQKFSFAFALLSTLTLVPAAQALDLSPSTNTNRNSNPWMRTCRIAGGISLVLPLDQDQVLLCNLDGALVGSYDLFLVKTAAKQTLSIQTFLSGITDVSACNRMVRTEDLEGNDYQLCVFRDGSVIDKTSLEKGYAHPDNKKLNEVLRQTDSSPLNQLSVRPKI